MKKWISWILAACLLSCLTACGEQPDRTVSESESEQTSTEESEPVHVSNGEAAPKVQETNQEHILIAYFSWADNTVVEDEAAAVQSALAHYESIGDRENYSDVDAVASASVVAPGNTAKMAQWIQEYMGGDIFPILVTEPYPDNYDECLDRAANEKAENARPLLVEHLDNIADYDVIFLGYPNWWSTAPMAVFSFIEEYDLSEKTIVPFCSHGTGGTAASVRDITAALPGSCEIMDVLGVYRADIKQSQSAVNEWLESLGFGQNTEKMTEVEEVENGERKLKLTLDGKQIDITLYDTPAANALYEMLPLDLDFEDFNGVEKISYLSQKLPTEGEPDGCDPDVGDFCLYAPWGNLSIFYQDFRYSDSLIMLGHIDSGMDLISGQDGDFSATLEVAE